MKQTIDLMKPRIVVENLYPDCPFDAGQILYFDDNRIGGEMYVDDIKSKDPSYILKKEADKYPYLFRKLFWYEERKPEEIKEVRYVKDRSERVYQLLGWEKRGDVINAIMSEAPYVVHVPHLFPATEYDFTQYLKSKS